MAEESWIGDLLGYKDIRKQGSTSLPRRTKLEFAGDVTAVDVISGGEEFTRVTIGSGSGLTITPSALTADVNDYSPTDWSQADVVRLSSDAARTITGFDASAGDPRKTLINVGNNPITVSAQDALSTAVNRVAGGADFTLQPNDTIEIGYDAITQRWRILSFGGDSVLNLDNLTLTNNLSVGGNISATGASPTVTIGNQTGSPIVNFDKSDAGQININFRTPSGTGGGRWTVLYASGEGISLQRRDNAGSFIEDALSFTTAGLATFGRDVTLAATDSRLLVGGVTVGGTAGFKMMDTGGGRVVFTNTNADATQKSLRLGIAHYTNSEEFMGALVCFTNPTSNILSLGGGSSVVNAATAIQFFTGADNITPTGTERGVISSGGTLTWHGTLAFSNAGTASGTAINHTAATFQDVTTDSTNKFYQFNQGQWNVAHGAWIYLVPEASSALNTLYVGGYPGSDGATYIPFYTSAAVNTAVTLRGSIDSGGTLTWRGNLNFSNSGTASLTSMNYTTTVWSDVSADTTNKYYQVLGKHYNNAHGSWWAFTLTGAVSANTLDIGGNASGDGATLVRFWSSTAVDTAATLRGFIDAGGAFNWYGSSQWGDGLGNHTTIFRKQDTGTADLLWYNGTGLSVRAKRLRFDTGEKLTFGEYNGSSFDTILSFEGAAHGWAGNTVVFTADIATSDHSLIDSGGPTPTWELYRTSSGSGSGLTFSDGDLDIAGVLTISSGAGQPVEFETYEFQTTTNSNVDTTIATLSADDTAVSVTIDIIASFSGSGAHEFVGTRKIGYYRSSGTVAAIGGSVITEDTGNQSSGAGSTLTFTTVVSGNNIQLRIAGNTGETWNWNVVVMRIYRR